jgi:hypothetical protein
MRKLFSKLAIVGVVALALAVASPVEAACTSDRTFGTYPSAGACTFYCYVFSSGDNNSSSVKGYYWVLGQGPTRNSGDYEFDGTGGSQPWFIPGSPFGNGWSLTTTVNNGQTTGCPSPDPTVWLFSDSDGTGAGLYALSASDEDLTNFLAYDLGIAMSGGRLTLQPVPSLSIISATTPASDLVIGLSWAPNGAAAFQTNSGTIVDVSQVLTGWNLYKFEVPRGTPAPTSRAVADWDPVTTFAGTLTDEGTATFQCDDPSGNEVFLALAPDLDNGFTTTAYVGGISTRIECDPNIADPAARPKPRLIEKPNKVRRR